MTNVPAEILQKAMDLGDTPEDAPEPRTPAPSPTKARAARTRAAKAQGAKGAAYNPVATLLAAVKFATNIQGKNGTVQQTHCVMSGNWVAATNGVLTAACPVEEDMSACPHSGTFVDALAGVSGEVSITQLSDLSLSIASGDFRAVVPCIPFDQIQISAPDAPVAVIDNRLKEALLSCVRVPNEGSNLPHYAGVLIQAQTVVATNGAMLFEAFHGIDLPPGLLVPLQFVKALGKVNKNLAKFGFSPASVTFWFDDGSFLKTQRFSATFPSYAHLFDRPLLTYLPVPENFEKAINFVLKVGENNTIYFRDGYVVSSLTDETPSQYRTDGLPNNVGFDGRFVKLALANARKIAFQVEDDKPTLYFVSDIVRGILMGLVQQKPNLYNPDEDPDEDDDYSGGRSTHGADFSQMSQYDDDDIPF